ncbi:MAG TPA: efflux transporter outer membrane subunit [Burkholderiales bacterium]|nr:efflux transporter outer membrane subunit [Burkholderiales bacterium]
MKSTIAVLLAGMMAGCTVGPDFHRPESPKVTRYTEKPMPQQTAVAGGVAQHFSDKAAIPADWWTLYHSRTLDTLVKRALVGSPTLDAARETLIQAQEDLAAELGLELPSVELTPSAERERFSPAIFGGSGPPSIFNLYNASVKVSYGIDIFGGLRRQVESQQAQVEYEGYQYQGAILALTSNVVTSAVTEASLREQIRATEEIISAEKKQLRIIENQLKLGGVSRSDLLLQKSQLAQTMATLPPLEKSLSQVRHQLAVYVGMTPQDAKLPEITLAELNLPKDIPVSLPSKLAEQRPDIRASEALLHEASAQVGVATANLYPQVTLSANIGSMAVSTGSLFTNKTEIWNLTGSLTQPIFNGGQLRAQKKAAVAAYKQAFAQYRSTVLQAFKNVADSLRALDADAAALKANQDAEVSSKDALDLVRKQYNLGAASYLSLLASERQYQQSRIGVIQARASRMADTAALFQSLGGGWWHNHKNGEVSDD